MNIDINPRDYADEDFDPFLRGDNNASPRLTLSMAIAITLIVMGALVLVGIWFTTQAAI